MKLREVKLSPEERAEKQAAESDPIEKMIRWINANTWVDGKEAKCQTLGEGDGQLHWTRGYIVHSNLSKDMVEVSIDKDATDTFMTNFLQLKKGTTHVPYKLEAYLAWQDIDDESMIKCDDCTITDWSWLPKKVDNLSMSYGKQTTLKGISKSLKQVKYLTMFGMEHLRSGLLELAMINIEDIFFSNDLSYKQPLSIILEHVQRHKGGEGVLELRKKLIDAGLKDWL